MKKGKNLVLEDKTISLRKLPQLVPASQSTVRKVVRDVLKLKSYKKKYSYVQEREKLYFQQDGAPPHRKKEVQDWLKGKFGDKFINTSRWPPRSPDLNPCDFSLWGGLKSKVYEPKPKNLEELKQNITREIKNFQKNDMQKHFVNLEKRLEMLINEKGGHIEHLLK